MQRFHPRIRGEAGAGFFRLGQAKLPGGDRLDPQRRQQRGEFLELARIMGGDEDARHARPAVPESMPGSIFSLASARAHFVV